MPRLTRRRLFAAGGAAGAAGALAACGVTEAESERSADGDGELLAAALAAEGTLSSSALSLSEKPAPTDGDQALAVEQATVASAVVDASRTRAQALQDLLAEAEGEKPEERPGEESLPGLATAAAAAIAAYREGAALLSTPELRTTMLEQITQAAAELAAVRGLLGEEPSPFAFVTGGAEEPFQDTDFDPTPDE